MSGIYLNKGACPQGQVLTAVEDPTMACTILSRWDDGSAFQCIAVGITDRRQLQIGKMAEASQTNLTPAAISAIIQSVVFTGFTSSPVTISNFSTPLVTWWANPRCICARYNAPLTSGLLGIIDIFAYSDGSARADVRVMNTLTDIASPVKAASAIYTNATVKINGTVIATVTSGSHEYTRGWYAKAYIGVGPNPACTVTQNKEYMQSLPFTNKMVKDSDQDLQSAYKDIIYTPFATCQLNVPNMGGTGDSPAIGPLPLWDSRYIQSGNVYVAKACVANSLAVLSCNVHWTSKATGLPPTFDEIGAREFQHGNWPVATSEPAWEHAHSPGIGLIAWMIDPAPVHVEIAQGIATWMHCWRNSGSTYPISGSGYQERGKAWLDRSYSHAIMLSPAGAWKTACQKALSDAVKIIADFMNVTQITGNNLRVMWNYQPSSMADDMSTAPGYQHGIWLGRYHSVEMCKIVNCETIPAGPQRDLMKQCALYFIEEAVRTINECPQGQWRLQQYTTTMSRNATQVDQPPDWAQMFAFAFQGTPPGQSGPWLKGVNTNWSEATAIIDPAGAYYPEYFYATLVTAVEMGVPGAKQAWNTLMTNLTSWNQWSAGFANIPKWGWTPRSGL